MELIDGKPLLKWIVARKHLSATERERQVRAVYINYMRGIAELHGKGIIHRDLKLDNVLALEDLTIKIIDFGLSTVLFPRQQSSDFVGTLAFLSPEILRN